MGLMDLNLKYKYDSDHDDMITEFYNPVLSESINYYRLSGFFSSSVLATVARGMEYFIKNEGKMKLVCSAVLSKEDIDIINNSYENPDEIIENYLSDSLDDIQDEFTRDHVGALGWMLAKGNLEIKIAIVPDKGGMFHQKIGIVEDKDGNALSFSGSNNETATGLECNVEDFKVFKSWDEGQKEYFKQDLDAFNKYWNNESQRTNIYELPQAIKDNIIKKAPRDLDNLNLKRYELTKNQVDEKPKFRDYQKDAINAFLNNGKKGIFEMATGTGKTFTALGCFYEVFSENENLITVIAAPQSHLIDQWIKDVKKFYKGKILVASSKNHKWKKEIKSFINNFYLDIEENIVIITTHKTLSSDYFIENVRKLTGDKFLIVDEVHGIGSTQQLIALQGFYDYRLGLSATPNRWFDKEGTQAIISYFDKIIFEFDIGDALNTINPDTGEFFLTPYIYKPIIVDLNDEEYDEYISLSYKIANLLNKKNKTQKDLEDRSKLCIKRKNIINNAESKIIKLEEILKENKDIKDLIIFCSPQQRTSVQKVLNENNITQHKFTHVEKIKKDEKYNGLTEREYIIKNFENGDYNALVAIKCLDEGVDIPSARNAIIMSSTSNPREHVQRRGRILRRFPGKKEAKIYDLLVFQNDETDLGKKLTQRESKRYKEFAENAKNSLECIINLKKYYEV